MRISDWSSDVCSSDLRSSLLRPIKTGAPAARASPKSQWKYDHREVHLFTGALAGTRGAERGRPRLVRPGRAESFKRCDAALPEQIGRASCRESRCQYV